MIYLQCLSRQQRSLLVSSRSFGHVLWGAILFISSEAMFFAALFTVYFYLRGRIPDWEPVFGEKRGKLIDEH